MCYGHVDVKVLEREAQERLRGAAPLSAPEMSVGLPPELIGGWRGVWARFAMTLRRLRPAKA
jgi:hypothetical protein